MNNQPYKTILIFLFVTALAACGGSSGGSDDPETSTDCVLGTSTIGDCTI
jgi:hypothetical protein